MTMSVQRPEIAEQANATWDAQLRGMWSCGHVISIQRRKPDAFACAFAFPSQRDTRD